MRERPLPNGGNGGRDRRGRFGAGNRAAAGRAAPHAATVASLRAALLEAVTTDDVQAIAKALIEKARAGDLRATRELFDRVLGAPERMTWTADNLDEAVAEAMLRVQRRNHLEAAPYPEADPLAGILGRLAP